MKRRHAEDALESVELKTPLAVLLLNKFAWGRLSATEVQEYADTALKSGAQGFDLECLAKIGAYGQSKNNCARDLEREFFKDLVTPARVEVECNLKVKTVDGVQEQKKNIPVILPEAWQDKLEANSLLSQFTCGKQALKEFWKAQDWDNNPQLQCWKPFWQRIKRSFTGSSNLLGWICKSRAPDNLIGPRVAGQPQHSSPVMYS